MNIHKPQKIDIDQIYPCPCPRKRGKLKPIALTNAFGCDRCSLLFELENDGYSLLQLGGLDSQRHLWQWIGKWQAIRESNPTHLLEIVLRAIAFFIFLVLIVLWTLNLKSSFIIPVVILLFSFLGLVIWRLVMLHHRNF